MFNRSKEVYTVLQDAKSRFLYEKRCLWTLTGDGKYLDDIILSLVYKQRADEMMKRASAVSDRLVIRGVGNEYQTLKRFYPELSFTCFADWDPVKVASGEIDGHKVISVEEFYRAHGEDYVLVTSSAFNREILKELEEHDFPAENILNFGVLCQSPEQYFEAGIISPQEHEVFIDGGCYDGNTVRAFVRWCAGKYDRIFSFEPDQRNYELAVEGFRGNPVRALTLLNKGLWNKEEDLFFNASGTQGSSIIATENDSAEVSRIETVSVDQVLEGGPVSFIKLDVEGAEYEALLGAEKSIRKYHPRMAVSIYHKPEDIFTLPELILEFSPEYRFYLRHYQLSPCETILYAV